MHSAAKLLLTLMVSTMAASLVSHKVAKSLGIHTLAASGHKYYGPRGELPDALICGSSLTYDGLDWERIAERYGMGLESWPVPGSSPVEWEQLQRRSPKAVTTFVGLSAYDLNEAWLCDFRADVVPIGQAIVDLWHSGADTALVKRVLSCYPRMWVRKVFPTVGRSQGVLSGLRDSAREVIRRGAGEEAGVPDARLRLASDDVSTSALSDWPQDRLLRRLVAMRSLSQGQHRYTGPKRLALLRLLRQASSQGEVVVVVLPVSPPYVAELLRAEDLKDFDDLLVEVAKEFPKAQWTRLDRLPELNSTEYFYDLVHLNARGRSIATEHFFESVR